MTLLETIQSPADLKKLRIDQLPELAADMRKHSDGLGGLVRNEMGHDPLCGEVCIF